ncbi:ABC transporter substrate-binding protein [Yinghuangia sp. ASG 101]|uniref:ABC transporter substrate-binding protein n=1 Tax=Yinghuangia sp. ASG 101 TaxID=2896848 RepID=UPI001E345384|nr:ABC transporter substrate-binding protein [Yinghuangia sp. ASG 101]UGQ11119.1 ABC transporter substrate-binding protein [Yinghuangia sp. ASG 101]
MPPRIITRARGLKFGAVVAAGCLALSACGGGDDGASSDESAPPLTGEPIKIGYGASMSGPQAVNGLAAKAVAHAWEKYTNAHGGVNGHPVEIELVDTKNTVPGATSVAKQFLGDNSIDAIFLTDLVAEGTMTDLFKDAPVAIISGGGSSDLLWSALPGVFQNVSGSDYTIKAYANQAQSVGAKNFGWAACAEVAVCQENGGKAISYAQSIGMKGAGSQLISATATDYTAECLAFIGDKADAIAFNIGFATGTRFASDCLQQGYDGTFSVINSGFDQTAFGKISGFRSVGGTNGFPWWSDAEPVKIYREAMSKYSSDGSWASGNSTAIWSSFELLKKALETAKPTEITRQTVMDAMYTVNNETLGGLLPEPITYTKGQPSKPVGCNWVFKFNAGDDNPESIEPSQSGNGAPGDLASTCTGY